MKTPRFLPAAFAATLLATGLGAMCAQAATYTVTSTAGGNGAGTMRRAIENANTNPGPDTVVFDPTVFAAPQTIAIGLQIAVTDDVTVVGPEAKLTIDLGNNKRAFDITGGADAALSKLRLINGRATGTNSNGRGGTIRITSSTSVVSLTDSSISAASSSSLDGGGIYNAGNLTINRSTLAQNSAGRYGGAISNAGTLTVVNSTFSGNTSSGTNNNAGGGAIDNSNNGTSVIRHSTIVGNTATALGSGGVYVASGSATLSHNIVAGNTNGDVNRNIFFGALASGGYNLVGNVPTGSFNQTGDQTGVTTAQLNLTPLQDNGGPTLTRLPQQPSIAINTGDPNFDRDATQLFRDQRLKPRVSGGRIDIGAVEWQYPFSDHSKFYMLQTNYFVEPKSIDFTLPFDAGDTGATPVLSIVQNPVRGTLTSLGGPSFRYTPRPYETGTFGFFYKVEAGSYSSGNYAGKVSVQPNPAVLIGQAQVIEVPLGTTQVSGNMTATGGTQPYTFNIVSPPTAGALTADNTGAFTYTLPANRTGSFSFSFRAVDFNGQASNVDSPPTTITIRVK